MSNLTYQEETFSPQLYKEIIPLLIQHYLELTPFDDIELSPDLDTYIQLSKMGIFVVYTARDGDKLVGYNAFFVKPHIHYRKEILAQNDVIFLGKEYRNFRSASRFIDYSADKLRERGASIESYHIKDQLNWGAILKRKGSKLLDHIWVRKL